MDSSTMNGFLQRIRDWWTTADRTQKLVTGFGGAFLVFLLGATIMFAGQPKMQPVFTGMNDLEKSAVFDELNKKGFKVEVSPTGEVVVPEKDVQRAKMGLASSGKLPKGSPGSASTSGGFLDTPEVEKKKLRSQSEAELAASIMTLSGVTGATVHIAAGKDSAVLDEKVAPTAVVNVNESSEGALTQEEGKSIANLVQYSITGMTSAGVKVITNSGKTIYDGAEQNSDDALANGKMEAERAEGRRRQAKLQSELDQILGKGNAMVDVEVNLNMDPTTTETDQVTPSDKPISIEKGVEKMNGSGSSSSGIAGLESNTPGSPATPAGGSDAGKYSSNVISEHFAPTTTRTKTKKAMGQVVGMNITVTCNKAALGDDKSNAIDDRVQAALGANAGLAGFSARVIPVEFSTALADTEKKAADAAASGQRTQQMISLLPVVALILVGVMLLKALGKSLSTPVTQYAVLANGQRVALPMGTDAGSPGSSTALALQSEETALAPGLGATSDAVHQASIDDIERAKELEVLRALGVEDDESVDIRGIRKKLDIPLEQIKKMAGQKPELFAMLLKSWMAEERR